MLRYAKVSAVLIVCAIVAYLCFWLYDKGGDNERARVEGENINAGQRGNESAMSWRDCRDAGGVYHFDTGKCQRTAAGNR